VRVVAFSSAGAASRPSHETQVVTLDNGAHVKVSAPGTVKDFNVECRPAAELAVGGDGGGTTPRPAPRDAALAAVQDIVVGDTLLFTEDVFMDGSPDADPYHPAPPKEVSEGRANARFLCSRTVAAVVIGDSASRLAAGTGKSAGVGGPVGPGYIGQTEAAIKALARPADANMADAAVDGAAHGGAYTREPPPPPGSAAEALAERSLLLQIEWSVLSLPQPARDAKRRLRAGASAADVAAAYPETYALTTGSIVPRKATALAKLDVFRTTWRDEENASGSRWSLRDEISASFDA
jgi:hypothetical protein